MQTEPKNDPLAGLTDIPWAELEQAYGPADQIPDYLENLRSPDPEVRGQGRYWLEASICHQGTLYSASAPAVPFLVNLAEDARVAERDWIVAFLAELAVSDPRRWVWAGFDLGAANMQSYFEGDGAEPFLASYEAVEAQVPRILALASGDPEPRVRAAAAFAAAFFSRRAAEVRTALAAATETETEPAVIASMLLALALQDRYLGDAASQPLMRPHLEADLPLAAIAAAALSFGSAPGEGADAAGLPVLERALLSTPPLPDWDGLFWDRGAVNHIALTALDRQIPQSELRAPGPRTEAAQAIWFALMERPQSDRPGPVLSLAHDAMRPLFRSVTTTAPPEGGWSSPDQVPAGLGRFVRAVAARPFLCSGDLLQVLPENGLPDDLEALQRFLGVAPPSPLDAAIEIGGAARPVAEHLRQGADRAALIEAVAARDDAIDIAFALASQGGRATQVGTIGEMSYSFEPAPSEEPEAPLEVEIAAAATRRDPRAAASAARALAAERAELGPPRSYGRAVQIHEAALTLLCEIAAMASEATGEVPDAAFDAMVEAELGKKAAWPRLERYFRAVGPDRSGALLGRLADRGWKRSWPGAFDIRVGDIFAELLAVVPQAARDRLLVDLAGRDFWAALRQLESTPSAAALAVALDAIAGTLRDMESWARDEIEGQIDKSAAALARLGLWAHPVIAAAAADPARACPVWERALARLGGQVGTALRDARVGERDARGLVPLEQARAIVAATEVYVKGEGEMIDGTFVLESDRVWAAILSLEDAAELVREASRIDWQFHVRGRDNTALVERYGAAILPWLESRLEGDTLRNVPWCVVPCLLAIDDPAALELALRARSVSEGEAAIMGELELARRWMARHPEAYGALAELAGQDEAAAALLRDRAAALGAPVFDALADALGREALDALCGHLGIERPQLPAAVAAILLEAEVADIPRGPLWSIAELDAAAADFMLPLWDNTNYTTAAMRISGFASAAGDALVIETLLYHPGAGESVGYQAAAFGPGAGRREVYDSLIKPGDLDVIEVEGGRIHGVTNGIERWSEETGTVLIPQPFPAEHLLVAVRAALSRDDYEDVAVTYHLPASFAGIDAEAASLITPDEGLLLQLCAHHADRLWPDSRDLERALELPRDASLLFQFDAVEYPAAGEPASSSKDLVCLVEALRTRKRIARLPGPANSRPESWLPACADMRYYAGGPAWAPGDGPIEPAWPDGGPGRTPYWSELLARGWPHGASLMHAPEMNQPGQAEQTVPYLIDAGRAVMLVHWPRRTACVWARAVAGAEAAWKTDDPGVAAAFSGPELIDAPEAAELVARFVARPWSPPAHAGAELVHILEAMCGGARAIDAFAAALAGPIGDADSPALAAAAFELGFVLRRLPEGAEEARGRLAALEVGGEVGRALALASGGRAAAEQHARTALEHVHATDDPAWAAARMREQSGEPFDAAVAAVAGDPVLERLADSAADEPDPARAAAQLAAFGSPAAVAAIVALGRAHPDARPAIDAAVAQRPDAAAIASALEE